MSSSSTHRVRHLLPLLLPLLYGLSMDAMAQTQKPPGEDKTVKTRALEAGAKALQRNSPLGPMDVYLVGFHPMKDHPQQQMEAHHYCHQVNQEFAQCTLFDGNGRDANLTGIEYIISEKLFDSLPKTSAGTGTLTTAKS